MDLTPGPRLGPYEVITLIDEGGMGRQSASPLHYNSMDTTPSGVLAALERCGGLLGDEVVSVYAFGSLAEGRSHRESDVDVAVLVDYALRPTRADRFETRLRLVGQLGRQLGRGDVDVVILNDAPPQFARRIVSRGRRVHCRDTSADHAFVRTTLLRAADLEPFLRRTRRLTLEAIRR
ncbi:MAG: nucleotidyltransferase domain-containing protein [Acidobacteriota bacterium]|nr:nucleotidyltransferase domain-containing protein [Acidobacteriota bacterium]